MTNCATTIIVVKMRHMSAIASRNIIVSSVSQHNIIISITAVAVIVITFVPLVA